MRIVIDIQKTCPNKRRRTLILMANRLTVIMCILRTLKMMIIQPNISRWQFTVVRNSEDKISLIITIMLCVLALGTENCTRRGHISLINIQQHTAV